MTKVKEVLVMHHSHLDVGYTHPQPALWELQHDYIDEAIDLCEQTADWDEACRFRWTCEVTAPVMRWLESSSSRQVERFGKLLGNGQICISAMNTHMTPLSTSEQMARTLYPIRQLRETFGIALNTAINHDINGQPWPLSQVLLDSGIDFYLTGINCHFGGIPLPRPSAFWWKSPDGRKLLSFLGEHYSIFTQVTKLWEHDLNQVAEGLDTYIRRIESEGYAHDFIYLTSTNIPMFDNTPPDHDLVHLIKTWNAEDRGLKIRFATPEMLWKRLHTVDQEAVPVHGGDWTDYWNFGASSSAAETRVNRRTKQVLTTTELLDAFCPASSPRLERLKQKAWESVNLYDEHTWGASASVTSPDSIYTAAQWTHKANYAYEGNSLAGYLFGKQMETFCGNALQSDEMKGLLLVNPTNATQVHDLRIDAGVMEKGRHLAADRYRFLARNEDARWDTDSYGLISMKPFSWKIIPFSELQKASDSDLIDVSDDRIETPFYRIRYDAKLGRLTEVYAKNLDWNIVDESSEWSLFQYVHESVDGLRAPAERASLYDRVIEKCNNSISCWNNDWPARRQGAFGLKSSAVERHSNGVSIVNVWDAPGVENLEQRITFFSHRPGIELTASFQKQDVRTPESIYFAFPLNLQKSWEAKYDSANMFIALDEQQLPGSCRDWITVDQTISIFDTAHGVTLACPDAPLVQVGDFNFGRESKAIQRDQNPLLLAWALNNYWDTNFRASQPGYVTLRYELSPFAQFDALNAVEAGLSAMNPVDVWPVSHCSREQNGVFLDVAGKGLTATYVKKAEYGNGVIVRLRNHTEHAVESTLTFPERTVSSAFRTNDLEENQAALEMNGTSSVSLTVEPSGFASVRVEFEQ